MGYTHYFAYKPDAPQYIAKWPQMTLDAKAIIELAVSKHHVEIGPGVEGGFTDEQGVVHDSWEFDTTIWLNGVGEQAHETLFIMGPGKEAAEAVKRMRGWYGDVDFIWAFCKTARKEYDCVVGAILLRCHVIAPEAFVIGSDGDWNTDWKDGSMGGMAAPPAPRELYREVFGSCPRNSPIVNTNDGPPAATRRTNVTSLLSDA